MSHWAIVVTDFYDLCDNISSLIKTAYCLSLFEIVSLPYHFKKIVVRYKKIGYNINVMRQTACLVVNPIKVNSFAYLFNCTRCLG